MSEHPQTSSQPNSEKPSPELAGEYVTGQCDLHGAYQARSAKIYEDIAPIVTGCPKCRAVADAREAKRAERAAQRMRSDKLKLLLATAAIPPRFVDASFGDYQTESAGQQRVRAICEMYANRWPQQYRKGGSLVMTGNCGTGKTHLACAIGNSVMAAYQATVAFGTVPDLLRTVKDTYRRDSQKSERQALADLLAPDLLIVDEVGAQAGTTHELQLLFEVFNGRYQQLKPTIICSNLNRDDLETFLGERVMDRFNECGAVLAFDWESHRGKRADA